MIVGVADTHVAPWHLLDRGKLSVSADEFLLAAPESGHLIAVSAISPVEVVYLIGKSRLPAAAYRQLADAVADPANMRSGRAYFSLNTNTCSPTAVIGWPSASSSTVCRPPATGNTT